MKIKVIITGATGMVGEGVLHECLKHNDVEQVLVITRRPCGISHPKLKEIVHQDFFDITPIAPQLKGYNACYFCLGVSAVGKKEEEYTKFTYTLTINFATRLAELNPDMTFCYISGAGTDSTEKGRVMWARVKGKTENDLMKLPFKQVYNIRLAGAQTSLPVRPTQTYYTMYKYFSWMFSLIKIFAPNMVNRIDDLARVMINLSINGYSKKILESKEINQIAKELRAD
jgi:hypothetical protein